MEATLEWVRQRHGRQILEAAFGEFVLGEEVEGDFRLSVERIGREHWKRGVDQRLPVLGGRTPREAARDPRGRERLDALLLEFEWTAAPAEGPLAPDVGALRRRLGL